VIKELLLFYALLPRNIDILLIILTMVDDIFCCRIRIFGTDIGYRKLKALKSIGVEDNSEQKKQ